MPERIVVCFRTKLSTGRGPEGMAYLDRARELKKRAEALGASLCAWSAQTFAFEFAIEDLEEAVNLVVQARDDIAPSSGAAPPWSGGLAQGEMLPMVELGSLAVPGWGPPLVAAVSLARIARPGEVLVEPEMPAVLKRELLTCGSRVANDGDRRVRGLILDPRQTWRRDAAQSVTKLLRPALVGRDGEIARLVAERGVCGVVRSQPGFGGTRLLEEVAVALEPARSLLLQPAGAEPLGALRRAIARFTMVRRTPKLPDDLARVLDRVRDGRGADLESAGRLLAHWVAPSTEAPRGALLVDDAMEIDAASLDAVAAAATAPGVPPFFVVVRLDAEAPFPAQLAAVPPGAELELGALDRVSAARLASACTNDRMTAEAARRWAKRGRYVPLGIAEALAEALTTGELAWTGEAAEPRTRVAGKGRGLEPSDWIARRLAFVPPTGRALLDAVALLGGDAPLATVEPLVKAATDRSTDVALESESLVQTAWLIRPEPGWIALPTKTHRDVCLRELGDARVLWHRAASLVLEHLGDKLAAAEAAAHAELAGDHARAARLGVVAEKVARDAGLEWAIGPALVRRTQPPPLGAASLPPLPASVAGPPISLSPEDLASEPPESVAAEPPHVAAIESGPPDLLEPLPDDVPDTALELELVSEPAPRGAEAPLVAVPPPPPLPSEGELLEELATTPAERPSGVQPRASVVPAAPARPSVAPRPSIPPGGSSSAERRHAIEALSKGDKAEALSALRKAVEKTKGGPPEERCRALLAYGVALAAAGRHREALVEALDALARAREAEDARGEQACTRFLAKLAEGAGRPEVAAAWKRAAQRTP